MYDRHALSIAKQAHSLAARARRLIHAWIRYALALDSLGQPSGKRVRQVKSVELLPKRAWTDALNRRTGHMSDQVALELLGRYLDGRLSLADLSLQLEAETWAATSPLASEALRLIAEYEHGDWTKTELEVELRLLIPAPMGIIFGIAFTDCRFAVSRCSGVPCLLGRRIGCAG